MSMSREKEDFQHRTAIFEGAYRAWSHLGGLDPEVLTGSISAKDVEPITSPSIQKFELSKNGSAQLEYPFEPLPRSGLSHPFVKAVLDCWLDPSTDKQAFEKGLTKLRNWWQHRRNGVNKTAMKLFATSSFRSTVDKCTQIFFDLAHHLVVNKKVQPPRTLEDKVKQLERSNHRSRGQASADHEQILKIPAFKKARIVGMGEAVTEQELDQQSVESESVDEQQFFDVAMDYDAPELEVGPIFSYTDWDSFHLENQNNIDIQGITRQNSFLTDSSGDSMSFLDDPHFYRSLE